MYLNSDEFVTVCIEQNFDIPSIQSSLRALGMAEPSIHSSKIRNRIATMKRKGLLPLESGNVVDSATVLRGTSTLYGAQGEIKQQWVKSDVPKEQFLEAFSEAIDNIALRLSPAKTTNSPASITNNDLMSIYTIGDAHIGMLAWAPESGEDSDLLIAEQRHIEAMELLVSQSNPTKEAFIIDVGDFFHSDNAENRTAASGNALDVDGRYAKVLEVGLILTTKLIDLALTKHETVRWRSAIGNHNEHSALMMNKFIKAYYRNEPRVIVHDSPSMFLYHQFGNCLIGITHGHKVKAEKLGELMSVDCEAIWSSTKFRYWYTGHIHHQSVKEFPSCVVETFRTLASKDAWHSASGYRSKQDMKCITLHKEFGEISRNTVNAAQLPSS